MTGEDENRFLKSKTIGMSMSDPDEAELLKHGLGEEHLDAAVRKVSLHLLEAGARLAYGGDLRPGGFTEGLFELIEDYRERRGEAKSAVNYQAWPYYLQEIEGTVEFLAKWRPVADFREVPPPSDLGLRRDTPPQGLNKTERHYAKARTLTEMRQEMTENIDARVLLGGRLVGFTGRYPGLLEEAGLALSREEPLPLYLIGGFGGCTAAICELLAGEKPPEVFSEAYQKKHTRGYEDLLRTYEQKQPYKEAIDYEAVIEEFQNIGVEGLNNGLTEGENLKLFQSVQLDEVVWLILKGLRETFAPQSPR